MEHNGVRSHSLFLWFLCGLFLMCFTHLQANQSILLKQKKSILIQDKKANKAKQDNQQSVHHSLTLWFCSVVHPPSLF
jgi:hypothetical protein